MLSTLDPGDDLISDNIGKLQSECPNFKHIYQYLSNGTLLDDKKQADKLLAESNHYGLFDKVLYHFFQPRTKRKDERFIRQLACPRS